MTQPTTTRIAVTPQQKIRDLLGKQQDQIARALPKFLTPERFIRVALTTINKNPKLLECTEASLMACLMDCAQLGLEPDNTMGRAYLIPFNDRKNNRIVCTLIIGYKGLIALAYRSGQVKTIMAQVVCENDAFDFEFGLQHRLSHKPVLRNRGDVIAAYSYGLMEGGISAFDVMSVEDVERIQARSKAANDGPWKTDWDEMARKTVLKRLAKYLPLSIDFMDAVARDNEYESEEETRLKAAKIVLPAAEPTTVKAQATALGEGEATIPFPTMPTRMKDPVPARNLAPGEQEAAQEAGVVLDNGYTAEEIATIKRKEAEAAAAELAEGDPAGALLQLMAIDSITDDELGKSMRAFNLRIPRDFRGPDSLTEKAIHELMQAKAWNPIRTYILAERNKTKEQGAP
jgi:recombination protein RecT